MMLDDELFLDSPAASPSDLNLFSIFSASSSSSQGVEGDDGRQMIQSQETLIDDKDLLIESLFSERVFDRESLEDYLSLVLQSSNSFGLLLSLLQSLLPLFLTSSLMLMMMMLMMMMKIAS